MLACDTSIAPFGNPAIGRKGADRESYRMIVNNMIAYGASVAADQIDLLVEYIFKTYGRRKKN